MKAGAGKNKGSSYEREVGYKLSLWLSKGERRDLLCRTVGSGAQFTSWNSGHPGDLRSQHELANKLCNAVAIECKHWKNLDILSFLLGRGDLYKAMLKVKKEGVKTNRSWMLIIRQNHKPDLLLSPISNFLAYAFMTEHNLYLDLEKIIFIKLDEFLRTYKPEILRVYE